MILIECDADECLIKSLFKGARLRVLCGLLFFMIALVIIQWFYADVGPDTETARWAG